MADPFRSSRLVYRAPELPEDDAFFLAMGQEYSAVANLNPQLLTPVSKAEIEERVRASKERNLLYVVICLPAVPPSDGTASANVSSAPAPTPIGAVSLTKASGPGMVHHRNSKIGLRIMEPYQGQGYGTEAIEWVLDYGFRIAGLHRIGLTYFSWNVGAGRLYERMGFVVEGRMREVYWHDGGWHDEVELSMLEHEWRERQRGKKLA